MFAVLKTGGKQYRVAANDMLTVEKLAAEAGETVEFPEVLMLGGDEPKVGAPFVAGAAVKAEVLVQLRGPKVISFKKRRRKHSSQRKRGPPAVPDPGPHHRHSRWRRQGRQGEGRAEPVPAEAVAEPAI